ncbi:MAG: nucleotidyl transferase AbiEii/AbiGii toxin family protein [Candidatus Microthrix sp.]|nr:nucleotidyl transferase AbiEii/AbiGii toxin family protein [Candidatus Microthrix sp.]
MEELVATKIRALYQRSKGRDLFDLWLAVEHAGLAPVAIAACFAPYRPDGWSKPLAIDNLTDKVSDRRCVDDLSLLIPTWPPNYTLEAGAEVAQAVIAAIDD